MSETRRLANKLNLPAQLGLVSPWCNGQARIAIATLQKDIALSSNKTSAIRTFVRHSGQVFTYITPRQHAYYRYSPLLRLHWNWSRDLCLLPIA